MWYIGQTVICVNAKELNKKGFPPPLREGNKYIINEIHECTCCKQIAFDVGLSVGNYQFMECLCGTLYESNSAHWCASERFRPLQKEQAEHKAFLSELAEVLQADGINV